MKDNTATAVNIMVGISMTTAEPTLVLKKVMVASQPLGNRKGRGGRRENQDCTLSNLMMVRHSTLLV